MTRNPAAFLIVLAVLALLPLASSIAADQPSAKDIADTLYGAPRSFTPGGGDGRGITNSAAAADGPAAIDLTITFEFNSATLTSDGTVLVGNLGRALKDARLAGKRFRIEGHTDAVGGDEFNLRLSERRAAAVRTQLMTRYGIPADRIETVGYGESRLLSGLSPDDGANRRVRVVNLGDAP